jgi:predicted deacetylase
MSEPSSGRCLVVSLHDVAPPFEAQLQRQLARLDSLGVHRRVLKVVPNWQGRYPLPEARGLVALLQAEAAAGSQLVLHGLEHRPRGPWRGPWYVRWRAALVAGRVAEFVTLDAAAAERSARAGCALFAAAGLPPPDAFCAPGWLITSEALAGLRAAGLRWLVGEFTLRDLASSRRLFLPAFGQIGGSPLHETASAFLNWGLGGAWLSRATAAKAYLHPQGDQDGPAVRRTLHRIGAYVARGGWRPATYADLYGDA